MDYGIRGRAAVVTGASRGIGRAIALVLAREGARVALVARSADGLEDTAREIRDGGGEATPVAADLSAWDRAAALPARAANALGAPPHIWALSHAGMTPPGKIHGVGRERVDGALHTDVHSTLALLSAAAPEMMAERWGRIVVVGSVIGRLGQPKAPVNSLIKSALEGLVRNLALDLGRFGITANLAAPGFVDNERQRERTRDDGARARMARAAATGAMATPAQVAEVVAFLCSRAADHVTGAVIPIDGGLHVGNLL